MRYHVKGGIWKNTEDEILKAAVMKYGLNQWSRISSLIVRKSAKQCKERWYEWLDPQIKKTEWTKDEEEKLLHLAKMFPCQWRTIAPIVGRTAYQCMEHYEKLLDRAQGREPDEHDPRRLKPGEIDPNPETKPARPDPIDMEEDQKEMLNEARARLANTRGKKAKRKAREKQLEEARRLAALQKKRELKSAGIEVVLRLPRKKKKEMNYNVDVPFMRKVPEGSFKAESEQTPVINKFKGAISLQYLENRTRDEEEEKFKKIDEKRMKNLKQKNLPVALEKINEMNDPANIMQRNKLVLPEPQVSDRELEGISKLASTGMIGMGESTATKVLMGDYTSQRGATPGTVLRTPKVEDHVLKEAKLAISLRENQTPLVGGVDASADLQNYINYRQSERNANISQQPFKTPAPLALNQSAISKSTLLTKRNAEIKTPFRDEMQINQNDESGSAWENISAVTSNIHAKPGNFVKSFLSNLPKPQNKYEIDFTDNRDVIMKELQEPVEKMVEDSEDREIRMKHERAEREQIEFLHQTQPVQRNLPRPYEINRNYKSYKEVKMSVDEDIVIDEDYIRSEDLIRQEMLKLVDYDSINHPLKGNKLPHYKNVNIEMDLEQYSIEEKQFAGDLVKQEMKNLDDLNKENNEFFNIHSMKDFNAIWEEVYEKEVFYIPEVQMYFHINDINHSKKYDSLQETYNINRSLLSKEENISKKLEEKAGILTNGYMKRFSTLANKYDELVKSITDLKVKNKIYKQLKEQEEIAIVNREKNIEETINKLKDKESQLQQMYKNYQEKINELENL